MKHNADSPAQVGFQEVVVYLSIGRGPIGSSKGMLYLLKDTMIVSVDSPLYRAHRRQNNCRLGDSKAFTSNEGLRGRKVSPSIEAPLASKLREAAN